MCPICGRQLKLRNEHAGRIGRCIQCQTRLSIATDLKLIQVLDDIASSESNAAANSADDLLVGDSLFGVRFSRRTLLLIGSATLLMAIVGIAIFINQLTAVDLEKEKLRIRQEFQNREG